MDKGIERRLVQLGFSAAFNRVSHFVLLYKLRSIENSSCSSEFYNDRRQRACLNGKVSASVDVVSGVPQGSVLGPL